MIRTDRTICSEYINNYNPIFLRDVRSNHDVTFLTSSGNEIYYVLKYVVKNQSPVDNIAALTLSAYTKKLEKEKELKNERTRTQLAYGQIASMAYARSNLHEVSAVTAFFIWLHGTTFVSSHGFQTFKFGMPLE